MAFMDIMGLQPPVDVDQQVASQQIPTVQAGDMSAGGMASVVNPAPAGTPQYGPPASPEEFEQRKAGWAGFIGQLQSNPQMQQVMMTIGARMLQGTRPGQSTAGGIGEALQLGMMHKAMLDENARKAGLDERKMTMEEQSHAATVGKTEADTARISQETAQNAELFPETKKKVAMEVRRLAAAGKREEALALKAEFDSNPQRMAESWNLDKQAKRANINQSNAAAGASAASARHSDALTNLADQKLEAGENIDDDELLFTGKRSASGASKDQIASTERLVKLEHPDWDAQQTSAEVGRRLSTAKVNSAQLAAKVLEDPQSYDEETVAAAKQTVKAVLTATHTQSAAPSPAAPAASKTATASQIKILAAKNGLTYEKAKANAQAAGYTVIEGK